MEDTPPRPAPLTANELRKALADVADQRGSTIKRLQSLVGNVVVGQVLPQAAVKGGTGMKLRFGESLTRNTPDLDAAHRGDRAAFVTDLSAALATGWEGFTGAAKELPQHAPAQVLERVGAAYVMQPVAVKLKYRGKPFMTVDLEVGYDELEATTSEPDEREMSDEVVDIFAQLGLARPAPVRVLPVHHQIAQKLHACSAPGSQRAHDVVDLQLLAGAVADPAQVAATSRRLFAFRAEHAWPPVVEEGTNWDTSYAEAAHGLELRSLPEAITWVNAYIRSLEDVSAEA